MANINDYLQWRGELTLDQSPLNEVDKMILSRFSYIPFRKIKMQEKETIGSICEKLKKFKEEDFNIAGDMPLVHNLVNSNRFKDMEITDYEENTDPSAEKQFAAITIHLGNGEMFVSFCGTDNSLVGWKEDFNLSFMQHIPAQIEGMEYLKRISEKYNEKIHVGGHSKGGNVAVYAAVFDEEIIERDEYKRILNKIYTYIPQSSIIGRLLEHEEKYKVVESVEKGIMQHDIYSWQVLGTKIVQMEELTNGSEFINKTIRNWLKETTPEQRKNVIDILYNVVESTEAQTMHEISTAKMKSIAKMLKSYKEIDPEDKKMINQVFLGLGQAAKESLKNSFTNTEKKEIEQ